MALIVRPISATLTHDTDWVERMVTISKFRIPTFASSSEIRNNAHQCLRMEANNLSGTTF